MTDTPQRKEAELVELVRSIDERAPDSLHRQIEAMVADGFKRPARSRTAAATGRRACRSGAPARALGRRLAAVGALAAVAIAALAIGLSSGGSSGLTLRQASASTVSASTGAAPRESPSENGTLAAAVEGVPFPYWEDRFGWRSTGTRTDVVAGRTIQTVYYAERGRRIGYSIVSGAKAPSLSGGSVAMRGGHPYTVSYVDGRPVITWLRDGHLCVVSGRGVDSATLLRLASWTDDDTLA